MISQEELPGYIEENMPEFAGICKKEEARNVYSIVQQLLHLTTANIARRNMAVAKQCLTLADQLHKKGNRIVKNAIENVFVYSFTHVFFHEDHYRADVLDIVPHSLYEIYRRQLVNSHL